MLKERSDSTFVLTFVIEKGHRKTTFPLENNLFASPKEKRERRKLTVTDLFLNIQNKLGQSVTSVYIQLRTKPVIELGSD